MKKILLIILVLMIAFGAGIWYYRYEIFQFSAENAVKRMLPEYVRVDRLIFDLEGEVLTVEGFSILNPRGFQNRHLATIGAITCRYKMRGRNILDGIEITAIEAVDALINIERLADGRLNLNEVGEMMSEGKPARVPVKTEKKVSAGEAAFGGVMADREISDLLILTDTINVKNGKFTFLDKALAARPFYMTFEGVDGEITLRLSNDLTEVLGAGTSGKGYINGDKAQPVRWVVHLDPTTPGLTMSNRIEPENVDIILFKPYYDKYSPVDIKKGRFSGILIIDFHNDNIGSDNTLKLRGLEYTERPSGYASGFWEVSIGDIVRYLETTPGEIVFDFKIKGPMDRPRFYPGPNVSRAIQSFAVDTVSDLIRRTTGTKQETDIPVERETRPKSDQEIIMDVIKGFMSR